MKSAAEILIHTFGVSFIDIDKASSYQKKYGGRIEQILVNMGSISSEILPAFYATLLGKELLKSDEFENWELPSDALKLPLKQFVFCHWLPVAYDGKQWHFVSTNPLDLNASELISDLKIDPIVSLVSADLFGHLVMRSEIDAFSESENELSSTEEARLRELASEAPTVNLLNSLITRAIRQRASDMHIEPFQGKGKARFRIDGVLLDAEVVPSSLVLPLVTRLKILSNMDIAERRRPQDGKIEMRIGGIDLDIRVSSLPLSDGESVVMRFLRKDSIRYDMKTLGISDDVEKLILHDLTKTAGVVLLTGPTGSGKTTSLYTFLNRLNTEGVKIITLEDPVEYQLQGVNQVQVQPDIGFDFSAGLRSVVRQDPDIIMLGEIRDKETASVAMQSALTGHLVFSTVHTNDAPSAYTRLIDLGVDEFLINAALVSIVAQRLARCLCEHCAVDDEGIETRKLYSLDKLAEHYTKGVIQLRKAVGCELCGYTGYLGRVAVIEYLHCDDFIKALPKDQNFIPLAKQHNKSLGRRTLFEDGLLKAIQGLTTVEEVIRVAG